MIGAILMGLVKANLAAGAVILPVLGLRGLVRPRFGALAAYLLWLAPLAAGLAVLAPHPAARVLAPMVSSAATAVEAFAATAPASLAGPDWASLAFALWVAGALAAGAVLAWRQAAFLSAMGRLEPYAGVFRAEHAGVGPAVVGVLRPRIVAPADFETRFEPGERALILAHEGVHLRRGDAAVNAVACAVQCLCWFNPLAHLAARALRIDQELACDATVIGRFPEARRTYAELLLKTQLAAQPLPLGCHWPAGAAHPLKARIAMLKSPLPQRDMRAMGVVVVAGLTLGAGGLAWASSPSAPHREVVQSRVTVSDPAPPAEGDLRVEQWTTRAQGHAKTPVRYAPGSYTPPPGAGEPRTNAQSLQGAPFHSIWLKKPSGDDLVSLYPAEALARNLTGDVLMACKVGADGRLNGCDIKRVDVTGAHVPDNPANDPGFGAATLELSKLFQMEPVSASGKPTAGTEIRIPVRFRLPHPPQPVAPS
jgi:beta-lactamase regulating signal transducer with metallopeptidase domain